MPALGVLECVVNLSEGRRHEVLAGLAREAGSCLLDLHADADHHRSVLTLAGPDVEEAARAVAARAVAELALTGHAGAHPRLGVVDVVPFVPLEGSAMADAMAARDGFAAWAGNELGLPCFLYGPERALPQIRRLAFAGLAPDTGPDAAHPTAGATSVGARPPLVAYNLWLAGGDVGQARAVAARVRGPAVRSLGLDLAGRPQVSCNLVDPMALGPAQIFDSVAALVPVARAELVGLVPGAVLAATPRERWSQLDLAPERTIEARLARALPGAGGAPAPGSRSRSGPSHQSP